MATDDDGLPASFLGTGWSFPPEFANGRVRMISDEEDIASSLRILFGTAAGERLFHPKFGLNPHALLFEPVNTTLRTALAEKIELNLLLYEPRVRPLSIEVDSPDPNDGTLLISLDYEVRATNTRYNLVFPFYRSDANEALGLLEATGPNR